MSFSFSQLPADINRHIEGLLEGQAEAERVRITKFERAAQVRKEGNLLHDDFRRYYILQRDLGLILPTRTRKVKPNPSAAFLFKGGVDFAPSVGWLFTMSVSQRFCLTEICYQAAPCTRGWLTMTDRELADFVVAAVLKK